MKFFLVAIFSFFSCYSFGQNRQNSVVENTLGIHTLYLRQPIDTSILSTTSTSIHKRKQREYDPIKITFVEDKSGNDSLIIKNGLCFFNLDNGVVSSIIFEPVDAFQLLDALTGVLGNTTHSVQSNFGEERGWVTPDFCLNIGNVGNTMLVIYYDCNNSTHLQAPKGYNAEQ